MEKIYEFETEPAKRKDQTGHIPNRLLSDICISFNKLLKKPYIKTVKYKGTNFHLASYYIVSEDEYFELQSAILEIEKKINDDSVLKIKEIFGIV